MTNRDAVEMMEAAIVLARLPKCRNASAYSVSLTIARLSRLGREAHSYAERLCNYGERSEGEYDRKTDSIRQRVITALSEIGIGAAWRRKTDAGATVSADALTRDAEIEVGGDPRGSCLKVRINGASELRF